MDNGQLFLIPHGSPQLVVMEISSEKSLGRIMTACAGRSPDTQTSREQLRITHVDTSNLAVDGSGALNHWREKCYLWIHA